VSPLEKAQKESIIRRLSFIQVEMEDLNDFQGMDYGTYQQDRAKRRNVERIAENVSNAMIDIGKILLSWQKVEVPGTYREVFTRLHEIGLVSEELAHQLGELSRSRNILAHQYLDIKWETIQKFIAEAPEAVQGFTQIIHEFLQR